MKKYALILGLLLLTACWRKNPPFPPPSQDLPEASSSSAAPLRAGETQYVYDTKKTKAIHADLYDCLYLVAESTAKKIPEQVKAQVALCDQRYWEEIQIKQDPPTFYALKKQGKGPDPYEEFDLCVHTLADPMIDFPDDYTPARARQAVKACLQQFPK